MVTFEELSDLRLGKLQAAVTDWKTMVDKLVKIADGGDGGTSAASLEKKAKAANWKGRNATVTKGFVTTTAREFDDAVTAARSVHTILSGAHGKLKKCKEDLTTAVDNAAKKNIYINDKGSAVASVPPPHVAGDAKIKEPTQAELDAAAGEISGILKRATEADATAAAALRFHAQDKYDFRSQGFKSFDSAQKTIEDSSEFVKLAEMDPSQMSNEQLARLNELAKTNGGNPVFAERIATALGPDQTLKFFSNAVDLEKWEQAGGSSQDREKRMQLLGGLEKNLGVTLGTATQSGSDAMASWKDRVIALGGQDVTGSDLARPRIYGFQAMSNLMRHGTYESGFLNDYGDALVKYEQEHTRDVKDPGPGGQRRENVLPWDQMPSYSKMDQIHFGADNDAGNDPMTGFMKALSHNPDASTDFFSSQDPQDNSKWVLKDRNTFNDVVPDSMGYGEGADDYEGPKAMNEAMGDALVAGATGIDPGDETAQPDGTHSAAERQVLDNSLRYLSERGDDFPPELRDDMAKVLTNHGDVVHHSASAHADDPADPRQADRHQLLEVSKQISRDQQAYGMLNEGLTHEMVRDIHEDDPKDPKETLQRAGNTVGFLEEARYQALVTDKDDPSWDAKWMYHGFGSIVNFAPGVGDIAQRGIDAVAYEWQQQEQERIDTIHERDNRRVFTGREEQLQALADQWAQANPDHANNRYTLTEEINGSAFNGNDRAKGLSGKQGE